MHRRIIALLAVLAPTILSAQSGTPAISRRSENSSRIPLYEKYEIVVDLANVVYTNPYNPDEVDVQALFTAPGGRQWRINGFYDDVTGRNSWKVRFAPNEAGLWSYTLSVTTTAGRGSSPAYSFTAIASSHHGWLHRGSANPHYLVHDDGTPFFGVAMFWPWGIKESGLNTLKALGCNLVGFWNIPYDDNTLIESMSSGLGRYDQSKCSRIDALLEWLEQRDMVLSLSIWPHDLFCKSLSGWAQLWKNNPYNQLCDVLDIYENPAAWRYMEKQYRYITARWGYSRAMGPWEIINEITGTDAYAAGRTAAGDAWIKKSYDALRALDPYDRPVTASKSGGHFWEAGYDLFDMPNVHLYETDGGTAKFTSNPVRSSMWAYHEAAQRMWNGYPKPAVMGEAGGGADKNYGGYAPGSTEYTRMFHNALWATWSSGLACSPFWWAFNSHQSDTRFQEQLQHFASLATGIDYVRRPLQPAEVTVSGADAFALCDGALAFGWTREEWGRDLAQRTLQIRGLRDSVCTVMWYDTWKGEVAALHTQPCSGGLLSDEVPQLAAAAPDLAFLIRPTAYGSTPHHLGLTASPRQLYCDGQSEAIVRCLIFDEAGRFCGEAANALSFTLTGMGSLQGETEVTAAGGMATIAVRADSAGTGTARIVVNAAGLIGDTLTISMSDRQMIDDFESYDAANPVSNFWKVRTGTFAALLLEPAPNSASGHALRVDYGIGSGKPPYAGLFCTFPAAKKSAKYLRFFLGGDGSNRSLAVQINRTSSSYWLYQLPLAPPAGMLVELPLSGFTASDGSGPVDLSQAAGLSFNILRGSGSEGSGTIWLDDILFANSSTTGVRTHAGPMQPESLQLLQNWPNPFNAATEIVFFLPARRAVELALYDLQGRRVATLAAGEQEAGQHRIRWEAEGKPSGTYFLVLRAGGEKRISKCLLLR
ncbi:MAG TPA: DUF5060 domain-containing protein [bacterium]|nr:DUF5060 domain-containing protein [bacterium]